MNKIHIFLAIISFLFALNNVFSNPVVYDKYERPINNLCYEIEYLNKKIFVPERTEEEFISLINFHPSDVIANKCTYRWSAGSWNRCYPSCGSSCYDTRSLFCNRENDNVLRSTSICNENALNSKPSTRRYRVGSPCPPPPPPTPPDPCARYGGSVNNICNSYVNHLGRPPVDYGEMGYWIDRYGNEDTDLSISNSKEARGIPRTAQDKQDHCNYLANNGYSSRSC